MVEPINMHRMRKVPIHTAVVSVHMPVTLRHTVERFADENRISLGDSARRLLEAGARALGLPEVE